MKFLNVFFLALWSLSASGDEVGTSSNSTLINSLIQSIKEHYVLVEHIPEIEKGLIDFSGAPEFIAASDSAKVSELLTDRLQDFDKHFAVQWLDKKQAQENQSPKESWFKKLERNNSGFNRVEILKGNVGYIDFWGFDALSEKSRERVENVMKFVSDADALIIDLRKNGGGSAEMVQLISSYFLNKKTHLNSFYSRQTDAVSEFWTFDDVTRIFSDAIPLYVLTSNATFSAAEEFAYNFKHLKRATIIGESTKGGANPWRYVELGHGYRAAIPNAKAVNPVTNTNWEGVGVEPHISVPGQKALDKAYIMALETLTKTVDNRYQQQEIDDKLDQLMRGKGA